jgi:hypothetical protein
VVEFFVFAPPRSRFGAQEASLPSVKIVHTNAKANSRVALTISGPKTLRLSGLRTFLLISMQVIFDFLKQRTVSIRI